MRDKINLTEGIFCVMILECNFVRDIGRYVPKGREAAIFSAAGIA